MVLRKFHQLQICIRVSCYSSKNGKVLFFFILELTIPDNNYLELWIGLHYPEEVVISHQKNIT